MSYSILDKREPEVSRCRVCGSITVHSYSYSQPTMNCIEFLRIKIYSLEEELKKLKSKAK